MSTITRVLVLAGVVTLVDALSSVGGQARQLSAAEIDKASASPAITANIDFAVALYQQVAKENQGKNLFFSPYSMSSALAMTAEGARGETAAQMGKVLGFPAAVRNLGSDAQWIPWNMSLIDSGMATLQDRFNPKPVPKELRDEIASLRKELETVRRKEAVALEAQNWKEHDEQGAKAQQIVDKLNPLLTKVDQYEIRVANALWGDKSYPLQQSYLDTVNKFYRTGGVFPMDFKGNPDGERLKINAWVEDQTNKRIKDLIAPGSVTSETRLILTNAIYFKGEWKEPFEETATKDEEFTVATGAQVRVPLMHKDKLGIARYAAFNADGSFFQTPATVPAHLPPDPKTVYPGKGGFLVAELPYKGDDLSLVAILPQETDGLDELEKKLSSDNLRAWIGKLQGRDVNVYLPKFKLETEYQMKDALGAMGMARAFVDPRRPDGAQFDGMCASQDPRLKLYIGKVVHKAFVEVNEKGTEAAAATAVEMFQALAVFSTPPPVPFVPTFRADRPFLFAVRDMKTGTILFLGRIMNPKE